MMMNYNNKNHNSTTSATTATVIALGDAHIMDITTDDNNHYSTAHDNDNNNYNNNHEPFFWRLADLDHVLERSRDGSIHATDEVVNSISHLAACIISVLGSVLLLTKSATSGALVPWKIVSFAIYGLSLCNLFACSTIHHAVTTTKYYEGLFQLLDYLAIFPLIAGTFTPLCLVFMYDNVVGWTFLSVVWTISVGSMAGLSVVGLSVTPKWVTMTLYITLGWFGAFLSFYLYPTYLPVGGIALLILGGVWYTIGGYVYTTEWPSSDHIVPGRVGFHELWHIFVILGAATHFAMMYVYVLPYQGY